MVAAAAVGRTVRIDRMALKLDGLAKLVLASSCDSIGDFEARIAPRRHRDAACERGRGANIIDKEVAERWGSGFAAPLRDSCDRHA